MILLLFIFDALYGFASHLLEPYLDQRFGNGWYHVASHTTGVLLVLPVLASLEWIVTRDIKKVQELVIKYVFCFGVFGFGNLLGWIFIK